MKNLVTVNFNPNDRKNIDSIIQGENTFIIKSTNDIGDLPVSDNGEGRAYRLMSEKTEMILICQFEDGKWYLIDYLDLKKIKP